MIGCTDLVIFTLPEHGIGPAGISFKLVMKSTIVLLNFKKSEYLVYSVEESQKVSVTTYGINMRTENHLYI